MKKAIKTAGILSGFDLKSPKYKTVYGIMIAILIIVALLSVIPTIWMLMCSLKTSQEIYAVPSTFFPKKFQWNNIPEAWNTINFLRPFLNTLFLGVAKTAFMILMCGLGGYVISKLKPFGTSVIFKMLVWTMMLPASVRMVPLFCTYTDFPIIHINMLNTYWPFILSAGANIFNLLLFKNNFDTIPTALVEAARIDGASSMKIFARIMMPLSLPVIFYVSIGSMSLVWSDYVMPMLVLQDKSLFTVPVVLYRYNSSGGLNLNVYMMALTMACIPPLVIFIIFQRRILGGVTTGAVKG